MLCPYIREKETVVRIPNIDEETTFITSEVTEVRYKMMECQKEKCAAWQNGNCNY